MKIKNYDQLKGTIYKAIEPGKYDIIISEAEEKTSAKGNKYIMLTCTILNDGEWKDRKVWANIMDNEIGHSVIKTIFQLNNYKPSESESGEIEIDPSMFIGLKARVKIKVEIGDTGAELNRIVGWAPISDEFKNLTLENLTLNDQYGLPF